jgi:hypothetical protein
LSIADHHALLVDEDLAEVLFGHRLDHRRGDDLLVVALELTGAGDLLSTADVQREAHFLDHGSTITTDHGGLERVEDLFVLRSITEHALDARTRVFRGRIRRCGCGRFGCRRRRFSRRRRRSTGLHRRRRIGRGLGRRRRLRTGRQQQGGNQHSDRTHARASIGSRTPMVAPPQ